MIVKLTCDLPVDARFVRVARVISRTLLECLQVTSEPVDDIELVVGELCSNVIRHAETAGGRFLVTFEYYATRIVVTVEDKGIGLEFQNIPQPGASRRDFDGSSRIGGFGFGLVRACADRLDFYRADPQGTTIRAEKLLTYQSAAARDNAESLELLGGNSGLVITAH